VPARQRALRREAGRAFEEARNAGNAVAQVRKPAQRAGAVRRARQRRHDAVAQRRAVLLAVVGKKLDLHARHVDARRALAAARFARHA